MTWRTNPGAGLQRDPCGIAYSSSYTNGDGTVFYERSAESGGLPGGARWSSEHDCNPVCGCHLSAKCRGCNVCTDCDGCYCGEDDY